MNQIILFKNEDILSVIFLCLLLCLYFYMHKWVMKKGAIYFFAGCLLFYAAIILPGQLLGNKYAFSAQMISHVIILLVAAPLMVAGIEADNKFKNSFMKISGLLNTYPIISWLTGVGIMWFWHIPYIYNHIMINVMMENNFNSEIIMLTHHSSLLIAGFIFSWPILNPYKSLRLKALSGVLYLSIACVFCSLLGLIIAFAPIGIYSEMPVMNSVQAIQANVQLQSQDQQAAGLIMWVPCCFIYLSGAMILIMKWMNEKVPARNQHTYHI